MKPHPLLLHYYITLRCNCNCQFCDIQAPIDADLKDVTKNLQYAREMRIPFVDFTGGEPLLHPQLPAMLKQAKSMGYKTSVTTNGLLYPTQAHALAGLIDFFHISLDSLDPEQHNRIRGRDVFEQVMKSIDVARHYGEHPDIIYTVTPKNIDQFDTMVCFAKKMQLILIVNPVFTRRPLLKLSGSQLSYLERYTTRPYIYLNKAFHRLRRQGGNNINAPRCRVMDSTVVISPDNHLLLPCFHYKQAQLPITNSLKDLVRHPIWRYFYRKQGRLPVCRGCDLNCYFDPSFHCQLDAFFRESITAKLRYIYHKQKRFLDRSFIPVPAGQAVEECRMNHDTKNHIPVSKTQTN